MEAAGGPHLRCHLRFCDYPAAHGAHAQGLRLRWRSGRRPRCSRSASGCTAELRSRGDLRRLPGLGLIGLGAAIGAVVIVINEVLSKSSRYSLPPLAVGMGMYLPASL